MSERINVDHAFDPEARKAQADFDAYMDSRPYQDEKGRAHAAQGGKFINTNKYYDDLRDDHYAKSLEQGDYSNESLEQLAQRVADARAEGDKTRANDAEEAFFNKFAEYSGKYGWEDEDGSADGPHVDKNAKLGRSTIDDRLDRYSKIMYGDESVTAAEAPVTAAEEEVQTVESQPEATEQVPNDEPQNDSYVPKRRGEYKDETDTPIYDELMAKHRAATAEEASADQTETTGFDVDAEVEATKAKLAEEAARKEAEAVAAINGTDQARADRELLDSSKSTSSEEIDDSDTGASDLKILGEQPVVSAEDLKLLGGNSADSGSSRSGKKRIRDALTPAGAAAEVSAWAVTREKGGRRNRIAAALGGAALLIGGGLLLLKGHDPSVVKDVVTPDVTPTPDAPTPTPTGNGGGRDLIETVRVNPGDGEIKVAQSLLESNGVHVNATEAQQIGEHANVHDILKGDSSYAHSGSSMDRIGKTGEFEARKGVVSKLLKAARQLGHK